MRKMMWCWAAWPISFGSQGVERIVIESEFARDSWMAWIWNISRMYFMHSNVVKVHISTLKTFRCSVPLSTYIKMERAYVHKRRSSSPFCFPLLSFFCFVWFSFRLTSLLFSVRLPMAEAEPFPIHETFEFKFLFASESCEWAFVECLFYRFFVPMLLFGI